jgi:hypothetical protein
MASLVYGSATSHAFALEDPQHWDELRLLNRRSYERRYGVLPDEQPGVRDETDAVVRERYTHIRSALDAIRQDLLAQPIDALILVADDQNEHFTDAVIPQLAIYTGGDFTAGSRAGDGVATRAYPELAEALVASCVGADFDVATVRTFAGNKLFAHAFGPLLHVIDPAAKLPVIPVFVNAIHVPAPSPRRCFEFGRQLRRAVEGFPGDARIAICGSGGLSHYTAGFPWKHYSGGTHGHGSIDDTFDRWVLERVAEGDTDALAALTTEELIAHGDIELRSWIVTLGAVGSLKSHMIVYEPFYRGIMGMGVASWIAA